MPDLADKEDSVVSRVCALRRVSRLCEYSPRGLARALGKRVLYKEEACACY